MRNLWQRWLGFIALAFLFLAGILFVSSVREHYLVSGTKQSTSSSHVQQAANENDSDQATIGSATISPLPPPVADPALALANYHFGVPEVVLKHDTLIGIVQWLPNSHELLLQLQSRTSAIDSIEILNLKENLRKQIVQGQIVGKPTWVDSLGSIAYLAPSERQIENLQNGTTLTSPPDYELWLLQENTNQNKMASDLSWSMASNSNNLWVVDGATQYLVEFSSSDGAAKRTVDLKTLGFMPSDPTSGFHMVASPDGSRLALFDNSRLILFQVEAQSGIEVDLASVETIRTETSMNRVFSAVWSPDSSQLAMILTTGSAGLLPNTFLTIYDTVSERTTNIPLAYDYVTDVVWTPNSRQLLAMAVIGNKGSYDQAGLFFIDPLTGEQVRVLSNMELWIGEFGAGLAWSSDGANLAIYCPTLEVAQVCWTPVKIEK